ncbi:MAG: hypothetical protein FWF40_02125 [Methanomassiliicoccaceae archaeon]|nr:hypothetical protein [Methanomassiliicoccaceae archaeon]
MTACEYMQIDPSKVHDLAFIKERAEYVLSQWGQFDDPKSLKKLRKSLDWFVKRYEYLTRGGILGQGFAEKCDTLVKKGKMSIQFGTVSERYTKRELRQDNYNSYAKDQNKIALFATLAAVLIVGAVIVLMVVFS